LHVLSVLASSYPAAALIGLLASALVFILLNLNFHWDATTSLRFAIPIAVMGPFAGCALTFAARRLIDVSLRVFPRLRSGLGNEFEADTSRSVTPVIIGSLFFIASGLLFVSQIGGGGRTAQTDRCVLSMAC
jgi:hypothetical protein